MTDEKEIQEILEVTGGDAYLADVFWKQVEKVFRRAGKTPDYKLKEAYYKEVEKHKRIDN
ncbi:MAG: hypothetical protein LBQ64_05795 [Bacteroidales bacterium]|jgi:hypothetical protein|nr:hypothetical protein [Bacteroidales bacterium]